MSTQHTPYDIPIHRADINGYSPEVIAELEAKAEGYRRCFSDFAPLLEAVREAHDVMHNLHGEMYHVRVGKGICEWGPCKQLRAALDAIERRSA